MIKKEQELLKEIKTPDLTEALEILEKAKITSDENKQVANGFEKFLNMINPFKCQR